MMTASEALSAISEAPDNEDVARFWEESQKAMPETPTFLLPEYWREYREIATFDDDLDEALATTTERIRASEALTRLVWHTFWRIFLAEDACNPGGSWPSFNASLGESSGMVGLLAALGSIPLIRENLMGFGFTETDVRHTVQQIRRYCDDCHRRGENGQPGVYLSQVGWMRNYTRKPYVRIGRLEFWLDPTPLAYTVFRHRETREVVALAAPGIHFNDEGYIFSNPDEYRANEGWSTTFTMNEKTATGYLLSPFGMGLDRQVTLQLDEWDIALQKGDDVLQLHIPSGGRMSHEACGESFRQALQAFRRNFPEREIRAITCASWIFSNLLEKLFPPEANLNRFIRELYLEPRASNGSDGLWFIFLQRGAIDPASAPRETSLQRRILEFLENGGRWRHGGMFMLADDIADFGKETYRSNWPPKSLP